MVICKLLDSLKILLMMMIVLYYLSIVDGIPDISLYSNVSYSPRHHHGNNISSRHLNDDYHQAISSDINTSIILNTRPFVKDDRNSSRKQINGLDIDQQNTQIDLEHGPEQIDLDADLQRAVILASKNATRRKYLMDSKKRLVQRSIAQSAIVDNEDMKASLLQQKATTNVQHHALMEQNQSKDITIEEALQGRYHVATDSLVVVDDVKNMLLASTINSTFEQRVMLWLYNESDLMKYFDSQEEIHSWDPAILHEIGDVLDTIKARLQQQQRAQIERNRLIMQEKNLEITKLKKQQQSYTAARDTDQLQGTSSPDVLWQLLRDERIRSSSLQEQVHLLQSQLNQSIDDIRRDRISIDDTLQKQLEDERMNATILQHQVHFLEVHIMNLTSTYMSCEASLENAVFNSDQLHRNQTVQLTNLEEDILNCEMRCHAMEDQLWSRQIEFDEYQSIVNRSKNKVIELKKADLASQIKICNGDIIASKDLQIHQLQQRLLNQSIILLERQQQKQHLHNNAPIVYLPSPPPTICSYTISPNGSMERPSMIVDNSRITMRKDIILDSIVESAKAIGNMINFEQWSTAHTSSSSQVIFTCALSHNYFGAKLFAGTARKSGFTGDIVVAVLPAVNLDFLTYLKLFKATVYTAPLTCSKKTKKNLDTSCDFLGEHLPLTLIRSFIYQYWALKYPDTTYIMMTDFRDVFFQSNPFTLKNKFPDWGPSAYDIVFSAEHHPNRVISRCPRTSTLFMNCYGKFMLDRIGASTILNNGVFFATRNASLIYNYLILEQRHEHARNSLATNFTSNNKYCYTTGIDQAFHNYLFYSGDLHHYFKIKVFPQGEGPINTLGGFYGSTKILRASLSDWRILRGEGKFKYVYNWNGEISPVVHQLDRFLATELQGGFQDNLAVLQNHRLHID